MARIPVLFAARPLQYSQARCYTVNVNPVDLTLLLATPLSFSYFVVFCLGLLTGVAFFIDWLFGRPGRVFMLPWAFGLLLLHWLQLPAVLASSGSLVYVSEINNFITFTFPLAFIGMVLIYAGMMSIAPPRHRHTFDALIILELAIALLVYLVSLLTNSGAQSNFVLVVVTNLLFFIPMYLLLLLSAWQWHQRLDASVRIGHIGLLFLMGWALAGIINHALLLPRLLAYPQQFWFVAYVSYQLLYFMEAVSVPMLLVGLLLLRISYRRVAPPKLPA